jgi:hypothetical protein
MDTVLTVAVDQGVVALTVGAIVAVALGAIALTASTDPMPGYTDVPPADIDPV